MAFEQELHRKQAGVQEEQRAGTHNGAVLRPGLPPVLRPTAGQAVHEAAGEVLREAGAKAASHALRQPGSRTLRQAGSEAMRRGARSAERQGLSQSLREAGHQALKPTVRQVAGPAGSLAVSPAVRQTVLPAMSPAVRPAERHGLRHGTNQAGSVRGKAPETGARRGATADLRAMAVEFPEVHGHPNRLPFEGCLTLVDVASDKAPSGARGHRVVLTREAAEAALPSLLGMAVDYKAGWDGHDARQKCGIITSAHLDDRKLMVSGFLFARDFPEMQAAGHQEMGMSYELADAHVADMRAQTWTLTRATFTGAAILLKDKAAYRGTSFRVNGHRSPHSARVASA